MYLGRQPLVGAYKKLDSLTFNGVTTTFNLTCGGEAVVPGVAQAMLISVGGVLQEPGVAYTVNGSQITFTAAPTSAQPFFGVLLGDALDVGHLTNGVNINVGAITANGAVNILGVLTTNNNVVVQKADSSELTVLTLKNLSTIGFGAALELFGNYSGSGYSFAKVAGEQQASSTTGGVIRLYTAARTTNTLVRRVEIDADGRVEFLYGQLKFPATQNPSTDANTLDDYEEGTFSPTIGADGGQSGQAYSNQFGFYRKIGSLVFISVNIQLSTLGTLTGNVWLSNLPFTAAVGSGGEAALSIGFWGNLTTALDWLGCYVNPNATTAYLRKTTAAATGVSLVAQGDLSATSQFIIAGCYRAT